jgi:hypothetical protein
MYANNGLSQGTWALPSDPFENNEVVRGAGAIQIAYGFSMERALKLWFRDRWSDSLLQHLLLTYFRIEADLHCTEEADFCT